MMISAAELKDIEYIKQEGLITLSQRLGPTGMARFIRLFDNGSGNFTDERREIVETTDKKEILNFLKS